MMMITWRKPLAFILTLVLLLGGASALADDTTVLARDAAWKFYDQGELTGDAWKTADFDDSAWQSGKAPLGFGDDFSETDPALPIGTVVGFGGDAANKNMTTYFRTTVEAGDLGAYTGLEVYIHVDDGCVVYVNGVEAFRKGIDEGDVAYDTAAKFKPKEETFTAPMTLFVPGKNVIAAEVHQDGGDSSDLWFELGVKGVSGEAAKAAAPVIPVPDPNAPLGEVKKGLKDVSERLLRVSYVDDGNFGKLKMRREYYDVVRISDIEALDINGAMSYAYINLCMILEMSKLLTHKNNIRIFNTGMVRELGTDKFSFAEVKKKYFDVICDDQDDLSNLVDSFLRKIARNKDDRLQIYKG